MAATNSTANLELSQFVGTDKPDWLTDYNGDMLKIDGAYGAVSATAEEAAANAESAAASATQAAADAAEAISGISGAVEAAAAATQAAEQATSVATSALSVANGAASTAQSAAADATQALSVANNAKVTAENAQAAAAQAATDAAASAADAATAQAAATQAATDAASSAAIASGVNTRVSAIEACIPATASASNKFATVADIPTGAVKLSDITPTADNSVIGDSVTNLATIYSQLYAKIDKTKLTVTSCIAKIDSNGIWAYPLIPVNSDIFNAYTFMDTNFGAGLISIRMTKIAADSSSCITVSGNIASNGASSFDINNNTGVIPNTGTAYVIVY